MTRYDEMQAAMAESRRTRAQEEAEALRAWTKAEADAKQESWAAYVAVCREATQRMVSAMTNAHHTWLSERGKEDPEVVARREAKAKEREAKLRAGAEAKAAKQKAKEEEKAAKAKAKADAKAAAKAAEKADAPKSEKAGKDAKGHGKDAKVA